MEISWSDCDSHAANCIAMRITFAAVVADAQQGIDDAGRLNNCSGVNVGGYAAFKLREWQIVEDAQPGTAFANNSFIAYNALIGARR